MTEEEKKLKVGKTLRGQAWVELHGIFFPGELRTIAERVEENCRGLAREDGDKRGSDN